MELDNKPPQVVIGTPGRTLALVKKNKIKLDNLKFFILDECDKVLEAYGKYFFLAVVLGTN